MNISEKISGLVIQCISKLYQKDIETEKIILQQTRKEFEGEITLVVFSLGKTSGKKPEQTALEIGEWLKINTDLIVDFNVVQGFLNLTIANFYWLEVLHEQFLNTQYGYVKTIAEKVLIEYSSPNTNKPLHLGHVRNNLLGFSLGEILKAAGFEVIKANLINDRGIHICKSMVAYQKFGSDETPESAGLKGDHLVGKYYVRFDQEYKLEIKNLVDSGISEDQAKKTAPIIQEAQQMLLDWENGIPKVIELWQKMNSWVYEGFAITYKQLGVDFDQYYYESKTYLLGKEIVEEGLEKGVFFRKPDNSVWIDLTADGLDEKIILRADGTSVYITQDLGTAEQKYHDFGMEQSIYVVGNEQEYHFKVLFLILAKLGKTWAKGLYHLSYGMVDLPSGKMKSREGTVVDADDLMAEMINEAKIQTESLGKLDDMPNEQKEVLYSQIGLGALKYFLLKVDPKKRILFNPKESIDLQGNTAPFIQYTYARINSVLRKVNVDVSEIKLNTIDLPKAEKEIIVQLANFPAIIQSAAKERSPAVVANYLFETAKEYNHFYHSSPISTESNQDLKNLRIAISSATASILKNGFSMLGIQVPEKM